MRLLRTTQYMASLFLALFLSAVSADVPEEQAAEVEHLIAYLANSDCRMVRNGKSHSGEEGSKHMWQKYEYFKDKNFQHRGFYRVCRHEKYHEWPHVRGQERWPGARIQP